MTLEKDSNRDDRERQLDVIIASYYRALDEGECIDQDDFIARHPSVAKELREFFADLEVLNAASPQNLQDPALEPTVTSGRIVQKKPSAGELVRYFGAYEILEELGSGGMGVVYKARHSRLRKIVALKMIRARELATKFEVRMFEAEARAAAKLDHPNIVAVHEVGVHADQHFYSMDYVVGGSLSKLHSDEPLPVRRAAELVRQLADAIHYAHGQGIVHRDLKPANILLTRDGIPRITDFGLAKRLWVDEDSVALSITETGQILGTAGYMSPEQADGKTKLVGPPADIYALGAVLYALLTGRAPFVGESHADTIRQVIHEEPVPARVLNPAVPKDLETICLKCLNKERHERYGTAQLLAKDLSAYLDGCPIAARPIGYIGRTVKWIRRHQMVSSLIALSCVLMVLGTAFSVHFGIRAVQRADEADRAKSAATQSLAEVELSDYLNRIALAQTEWQADNVQGCEELLDACPRHLRGWEWNYLKRLCSSAQLISIETGNSIHNEPLQLPPDLAFSSDNTRVFIRIGSSLGVWDIDTGLSLHSVNAVKNNIDAPFDYDPSHNVLFFDDQLIEGDSFEPLWKAEITESMTYSKAAFSRDGSQLALGTTPIKVLDAASGKLLFELPSSNGNKVVTLTFSPDNEYLAIGGREVLEVWSLKAQTLIFQQPNGGQHVTFDGSGDWLISGCGYYGWTGASLSFPEIRIWKVPTFQLTRTLTADRGGPASQRIRVVGGPFAPAIDGPYAGTQSIDFCPKMQRLAVASWDRSVRLFDLNQMILVHALQEDWPNQSEGGLLNAGWPRTEEFELHTLRHHQPTAISLNSLGDRLATIDTEGVLQTYDVSTAQQAIQKSYSFPRQSLISTPEVHFGNSVIALCHTDDRRLADGDRSIENRLRLVDLNAGSVVDYPETIQDREDFHLSNDGRILAVLKDDRLQVRRVKDNKSLFEMSVVPKPSNMFRLNANGARLALQSNGRLKLFDLTIGKEVSDLGLTVSDSSQMGTRMCFDSTGEQFATSLTTYEGVEIWNAKDGSLISQVPVKGIRQFCYDKSRLITVDDEHITCWAIPGRIEEHVIPRGGHLPTAMWTFQIGNEPERLINPESLCVSADFNRIAFRDSSQMVIVLDTHSGVVVGRIRQSDEMPFWLSPDGRRMLIYKNDGQLHLHHVDADRDVLNLESLGLTVEVLFSTDAEKIVGVSPDGIVRVLDGTPWEE